MYNKDLFKYKKGYNKFFFIENWDCVGFKFKKKENIKKLKGEITLQEYNLLNSIHKNKKRLISEGENYFKLF